MVLNISSNKKLKPLLLRLLTTQKLLELEQLERLEVMLLQKQRF